MNFSISQTVYIVDIFSSANARKIKLSLSQSVELSSNFSSSFLLFLFVFEKNQINANLDRNNSLEHDWIILVIRVLAPLLSAT